MFVLLLCLIIFICKDVRAAIQLSEIDIDQVENEEPVTCWGTNSHICLLAVILLYFLKIIMILAQIPGKKRCQGVFRGVKKAKNSKIAIIKTNIAIAALKLSEWIL